MLSTSVGIFLVIGLPLAIWYAKGVNADIKVLQEEATPSNTLLLFLGHKIQQRDTKKVENFEVWKNKVTNIAAVDFETGNFTKPEVSGEQQ